jgi:hypothetical protein
MDGVWELNGRFTRLRVSLNIEHILHLIHFSVNLDN